MDMLRQYECLVNMIGIELVHEKELSWEQSVGEEPAARYRYNTGKPLMRSMFIARSYLVKIYNVDYNFNVEKWLSFVSTDGLMETAGFDKVLERHQTTAYQIHSKQQQKNERVATIFWNCLARKKTLNNFIENKI